MDRMRITMELSAKSRGQRLLHLLVHYFPDIFMGPDGILAHRLGGVAKGDESTPLCSFAFGGQDVIS